MIWHHAFFRAPCFAWHPHVWLIFGLLIVLALAEIDRRVILAIALFLMLVALSGCAALSDPLEDTYQAVHLVDTVQTVRGPAQDSNCYRESALVTRHLIGEHPSEAGVIAWGIGFAAFHAGVTQWLLEHGHPWIANGWNLVTITDASIAVAHGRSIGIRIGEPNHPPPWDCTDSPDAWEQISASASGGRTWQRH